MKIEVLFPQQAGLFGDLGNVRYLQKCLPQAEFIETPMGAEPLFAKGGEAPALVYLGPMTERTQEKAIQALAPYKEALEARIQSGGVCLFTGNALELLGLYIQDGDRKIEGLGLLPLYARRDMLHRHNSVFLGGFQGQRVTGFKSQFTMCWPTAGDGFRDGLFTVEKGTGLHPRCKVEGVHIQNFFGTYLLGPVLLLNPSFTLHLLEKMGIEHPVLAFAREMEEAYRQRLQDILS